MSGRTGRAGNRPRHDLGGGHVGFLGRRLHARLGRPLRPGARVRRRGTRRSATPRRPRLLLRHVDGPRVDRLLRRPARGGGGRRSRFARRAALRLAQGSPEAAAADALACGRIYESVGIRNPAATHWRSDAALALLVAGRNEEARRLAAAELELARRWGAPRAAGHALRVAGLVEGSDAGLASLRDSVLLLEQSPALLERARSLVELGSALRRSLKRIEARDPLRAGLDLAQRCGALALAERAREELVAAGAKPRATAVSGAAALTPSERRVAGMASEGMTNRQIAQALFVTPRTVEMHLSNAFRKLRIGSRTQLPEALAS